MPFFYAKNLTENALYCDIQPWDFKLSETLTAQIRGDKQSRQDWYRNTSTQHHFYTTVEPINPNMRPTKDNCPHKLHGFAVDFDAKIKTERLNEVIDDFPIAPNWWERSLGGNLRLVWLFAEPLRVENYEFCACILKNAVKWLNLGLLPGLDEPAFTDPTRLLCNGCEWTKIHDAPVPANKLQAFFVECGKEHRFRPSDSVTVPLDLAEKALRDKYPAMNWPGEFKVGSMGPSFWVDGSVSAMSAIVKPEGMFTFSAHADKPFYSWGDILGKEFISEFETSSIANATKDIWFDGLSYYKKDENGIYVAHKRKESMTNYFRTTCRVSIKPGKDGCSMMDHVYTYLEHGNGRIVGAAPFIFRPPGVVDFQGERKLNIYNRRVLAAASEWTPWGPGGKYPWLSKFLDRFFCSPDQLPHFLAWHQHFYRAGMLYMPRPGQNVHFMGGAGTGKTLLARGIVGLSVGGFCDASEYLIRGGGFNSELLEAPLWCSDDETMNESSGAHMNFQAMLKKSAANQEHKYSKKFEVPCMVEWQGRVICTSNLDYISSRTLSGLDNSSLDKTHLFLCSSNEDGAFVFPDRYELQQIIAKELPYYLRGLLDWTPPAECIPDARYGFKAYHHPELMNRAYQSSKAAPFKELLDEAMRQYFEQNETENVWRGTETQLSRLLNSNPLNEPVIRTLKAEQMGRYLELIQKEGVIRCDVTTGILKTKVWTFYRECFNVPPAKKPVVHNIITNDNSKFSTK